MVRVGITGHRWNKLSRDAEAPLRGRVAEALLAVQETAARLGNFPDSGYRSPAPDAEPVVSELRLISALAEGSDRIFVDGAPPGCSLQAILPFPVETYARDFTEPRSRERLDQFLARAREEAGVLILDGDRAAPNAFEPVGTAICLNSDLLIAIWDGQPGKRGGTSEVVALAEQIGLPIVRIAPEGGTAPWLQRPGPLGGAMAEGLTRLEPALKRLFLPPEPPPDAEADERHEWQRLDLREEFFRETPRGWLRGHGYGFVLRMLSFGWKQRKRWWAEVRRAGLPLPKRAPEHYGAAVRGRWTHKWKRQLGVPGEVVDAC